MPIFFSPHADLIMAALSCLLALAGATGFVIAGEKAVEKIPAVWKQFSYALIILAAREWLGILALSAPGLMDTATLGAVCQTTAAILILLAARAVPLPPGITSALPRRAAIILFITLILTLVSFAACPYPRHAGAVSGYHAFIDAVRAFLSQGALPLASLILLHRTREFPDRSRNSSMALACLFCLYAFLQAVTRIPGLPQTLGGVEPLVTYLNTALSIIRLAAAAAIILTMWNAYSRAIGVTRQVRWWPVAMMFFFLALASVLVLISKRNYREVVMANIASSARSAAAAISPIPFLIAADDPGSVNALRNINAAFARARLQDFFNGYTIYHFQIDAVAKPVVSHAKPVVVVDAVSHSGGAKWLEKYVAGTDPEALFGLGTVLHTAGIGRYEPIIATAPIKDAGGAVLGAAAITSPYADIALDFYLFQRPVLLLLPPAFAALILLVSRQLRAWMLSHSTSRAAALRQGALGNEVVGVLITNGGLVTDCNPRLADLVGRPAASLAGLDAAAILPPGGDRIADGDGGQDAATVTVARPDGTLRHLLVYSRPLTDSPGEVHFIHEVVDITTQRNMEARIRENYDTLQLIIDTIPDSVFMKDAAGRVLTANRTFTRLLGIPPDTRVAGKTVGELSPWANEATARTDAEARSLDGGTLSYTMSYDIDGRRRHFEATKTLAPNGRDIIGTVHDITRRIEDAEAIRRERFFLLQLINTLPLSVCYLDKDEIIRLCDTDFCREAEVLLPEEIIGKHYRDVAPYGAYREGDDDAMLRRGRGFADRDIEVTKNGVTRHFKLRRIVMQDAAGNVLGLVKAFWDTTDLMAAHHAAKMAERAKAAFLATMSHELRTPMNGVVGMAELIIDNRETTPVQRLYAEVIIKSAKTLQMVMDEVMDIATVDAAGREVTLVSAPFVLLTLCEESVQIASCIIEAMGVRLYLSYDFSLRSLYHGDARQIRQILVQLLTHCSRLAAGGKLHFSVVKADDDAVSFRAEFTPPAGMPAEKVSRLFARPEAEAVIPDAAAGGPGTYGVRIGLPLLWQLIGSMKGSLTTAAAGDGVVCEILLPFDRDTHAASPPLMPPDLAGMRFLTVTQDAALAASARACLEYARARVDFAGGADEAKAMIRAAVKNEAPYALIVLDCGIGEDDHVTDLLAELQADVNFGNPPVMPVVSSRQVQALPEYPGNLATLLLPPLLPSEMWYKAMTLFTGSAGGTAATSRGTTTVIMRKHSTRITRLLPIPAKVLLVEDNTVNQMVAMGLLKRLGCTAVLAKNGGEALETLAEDGWAFDIIFMDCMMPVMDGYEATARIRQRERMDSGVRRSTIVALTANTVAGDKEKCLAAGMDGYITKPVTLETLRDAIMKYCPDLAPLETEGT